MKYAMPSTVLVISVCACAAFAHAQTLGSSRGRQAESSERSDVLRAPRSSWEGWLDHGARHGMPRSQVPPRSPDLGRATEPLAPSIGPGSGLMGPEAGRCPSRLRSYGESDDSGTGNNRRGR